eukprot:TRINITY_DN729_c0_g3_i1.p1 TRINITY_DN729_c0_g3~~TRINITY_DN729_c0_g3_i1.p1  ORF type:complete len:385 (+),score=55.63 TRINITY_DN729_c0_g3_i1:260-1414(+)
MMAHSTCACRTSRNHVALSLSTCASASQTGRTMAFTVQALYLYPVKSCRRVEVDAAEVSPTGFRHDRQWMIVDADTGKCVTQRNDPNLGWIQPQLTRAEGRVVGMTLQWVKPDGDGSVAPMEVSLYTDENMQRLAPVKRSVSVWSFTGDALDCGDAAAAWLGTVLSRAGKKQFRLVQVSFLPEDKRSVKAKYLPHNAPQFAVGFADGYPYLLVLAASIEDIQRRAEALAKSNGGAAAMIDARRFRPNVIIAGDAPPHDDDAWLGVRIGKAGFQCAMGCERCVLTTVDPDTLRFDTASAPSNPMPLMRQFRDFGRGPLFGTNAVSASYNTAVAVGDAVVITSRRTPKETATNRRGRPDLGEYTRALLLWGLAAYAVRTVASRPSS